MINPIVEELLKLPFYEQKSNGWFEQRKNKITASSASSLLRRNEYTIGPFIDEFGLNKELIDEAIDNKCANPYQSFEEYLNNRINGIFKGNIATYHGQKYEDVVIMLYSIDNNIKVNEFGMIQHPEYHWLGASPDGITDDGVMLEIKCPYRRKITGIPPFYYWIQCQLQMEICNLNFCDFAEYAFIEFLSYEEFVEYITENNDKTYGLFIQKGENPATNNYYYLPKDILKTGCLEEMNKWKITFIRDFLKKGNWSKLLDNNNDEEELILVNPEGEKTILKTIYWVVEHKSVVKIKRNKQWFNDVFEDLKKGYDIYMDEKKKVVKSKDKQQLQRRKYKLHNQN